MTQYDTRHGTLTIQTFEHPFIGRMLELRSETEQLAAIQAKDHYIQSFIIKAGNDVEQGMSNYFASVLRAFNEAITKKFKGSTEAFTPVDQLLEQYQSKIAWNGEGFEIQEAP